MNTNGTGIQSILTFGIVLTPVTGIIAVVIIAVFLPGPDKSTTIAVILASIPVTMLSLTSLLTSIRTQEATMRTAEIAREAVKSSKDNSEKIDLTTSKLEVVHKEVNSRMTELAGAMHSLGQAEGREQERTEQKQSEG